MIIHYLSMEHQGKKAVVIGAGFSGLSAAATLAGAGYEVSVLEKHDQVGGRARVFQKDGFAFDMGPSWYWMPEIAESFFNRFNCSASDFFELKRLDPSYQVIYSKNDVLEVPADFDKLKEAFELREKGSGARLEQFLKEARFKYEVGMNDFVSKPGLSWREFAHWKILKASFRMDLFQSFSAHIRKYFKSPELLRLLEFPVLFLGAMPDKIPALYSMMNYADMKLGTWYPMGGFGKLAQAMASVAENNGVSFYLNNPVRSIGVEAGKVKRVISADGAHFKADLVIGSADYNHIDQHLLPPDLR
ncbi:MAG TPA: phytoene desaturase family protein, partial [Sphingobacteriaceae bacterium]